MKMQNVWIPKVDTGANVKEVNTSSNGFQQNPLLEIVANSDRQHGLELDWIKKLRILPNTSS